MWRVGFFIALAACKGSIYARCESVKLGDSEAKLPFKLQGGDCQGNTIFPGTPTAGDVADLACCANAANGATTPCAVDCTQPQYQNVRWSSSPVTEANDEGGDWCCVAIQNGKVVARYDGADI